MNYLGIDYGRGSIGLAIGDDILCLASPFSILKNSPDAIKDIALIVEEEKIGRIVIGVPIGLRGGKSDQYDEVQLFIKKLSSEVPVEIMEENERLSTAGAQSLLRGVSKGKEDDVAAMIILQSYLDRLRNK